MEEENKNILLENICRTCLDISKYTRVLDVNAANLIKEICNVEILKDDELPYRLCIWCYSKLCLAAQFRSNCRRANSAISQWLEQHTRKDGPTDYSTLANLAPVGGLACSTLQTLECLDGDGHNHLPIQTRHRHLNSSQTETFTQIERSARVTRRRPSNNYNIESGDEKNVDLISVQNIKLELDDSSVNNDDIVSHGVMKTKSSKSSTKLKRKLKKSCKVKSSSKNSRENDVSGLGNEEDDSGEFDPTYNSHIESGDENDLISAQIIKHEDNVDDFCSDKIKVRKTKSSIKSKRKKSLRKGAITSKKKAKKILASLENDDEDASDSELLSVKKEKNELYNLVTVERARSGKRVIYNPFDPSKANIIKQTREQQVAELQAVRSSKAYLEAPYKCVSCAKFYLTQNSLDLHDERHKEAAGEYVCSLCTQRYNSAPALRKHVYTHTDRYGCTRCPVVFQSRGSVVKHAQSHDGTAQTYVCALCGKISTSIGTHKSHERSHAKLRPYKCTVCSRMFSSSTSRNEHIMRAHTTIRNFSCQKCGITFVNKTALRSHSLSHSDERSFYCVECDMGFKTASSLKLHLNCSSKHALPGSLKKKFKYTPSTAPWRRYACGECGARHGTSFQLREHRSVWHGAGAGYPCAGCERVFRTSSAVRQHHKRKHLGIEREKKYACGVCSKGFATKTILKHHLLIHTGERPYPCSECGKTFRHPAARWTHTKLVHKKRKLQDIGISPKKNMDVEHLE